MTFRHVLWMSIGLSIGCVDPANQETAQDATSAIDSGVPGLDMEESGISPDATEMNADAIPTPLTDATPPLEDANTRPACIVVGGPDTCDPNPPHNDPVGQVCANDGTEDEAYCVFDEAGAMVCARSASGGPCPGRAGPPRDRDAGQPQDAGASPPDGDTFPVRPIDASDALSRFFSQEAAVFGVRLVASARVPQGKLEHAATVMAEYLDNDEDGTPDDPAVVQAMVDRRALLVMFASSAELEGSGVFNSNVLDGYWGQDLQADETKVPGRFDATLEEVLHLISTSGYASVYPDAFGEVPGTLLTDAMDQARGGRFEQVPAMYPDGAWYHYDDRTCDYRCMATEYFYWALTTLLGAQDDADRCAEIAREWELCTAAQLQERDPAIHRLLTDPQYHLPSVLPDGRYRATP